MSHDLTAMTTALAGLALTWLVQSSVLLALGLLAGQLIRSWGPAVQSAVYRTTLVAVLICPFASSLLGWSGFDGLNLRLSSSNLEEPSNAIVQVDRGQSPGAETTLVGQPAHLTTPTFPVSATSTPQPLQSRPAPSDTSAVVVPRPSLSRRATPTLVVGSVLVVWLLGVMVMGIRLLIGQRAILQMRASAIPAEPEAESLCREVAHHLSLIPPAVLRSPFLFSPCLDGLRHPAILLPDDATENLRDVFVHELAHLSRRDGLWNLLRRSALALFWIQPLLWILSRRLEVTAEEVCDDFVVQLGADRTRYAGHLVELAGRTLPPAAISGVGMISLRSLLARRVTRILDSSRSLSTRAGCRAVTATLLAGIAGTLFAGLLGVGGTRHEAKAESSPAKATEVKSEKPNDEQMIRGQVVDDTGKPVAGATVIATRSLMTPDEIERDWGRGIARDEHARAIADREGRFELLPPPIALGLDPDEIKRRSMFQIIASAPGFGLGYYLKDRPIRLKRGDTPINGRVVNLEGRPVPGAKIRLLLVQNPDFSVEGRNIAIYGEPVLIGGVSTDADGRFRIEGLGRDAAAWLELSGPTIAFKTFWVHTNATKQKEVKPLPSEYNSPIDRMTYGADFTITAAPTRPIEGIVKDLDSGQPVPNAIVTISQLSESKVDITGLIVATTDAQGRYRLVGLPKESGQGHRLKVFPPLDQPYFVTDDLRAPTSPGLEPSHFDIALKRAIWIKGKLTDLTTGKPVRAVVEYFPMLSNSHAKDYQQFNPNVTSMERMTRYRTDRDGLFRIVGLPGRGVVTALAEDRGYRAGVGGGTIENHTRNGQLPTYSHIHSMRYHQLKVVEIPDGLTSYARDIQLDPGGSLNIKLVDETGNPVINATVEGRVPETIETNREHNLNEATTTHVSGIEPGETRTVVFKHKARKLGAVLDVTPEMVKVGKEITVALRPNTTISGRFVGEIGNPPPGGVQVRLIRPRPGRPEPREYPIADAKVDAAGRFQCDEIPPGATYLIRGTGRLVFGLPNAMDRPFKDFEIARTFTGEAGKSTELGAFDVATGKRVDTPAEKAASVVQHTEKPATADLPLTGRIVDLEGRPVAGVKARIKQILAAKDNNLDAWIAGVKNGEPPWIAYNHLTDKPAIKIDEKRFVTTTDADGRFHFDGLGNERVITLNLQGDTIVFDSISVITRKIDPFPAKGYGNNFGPGVDSIRGADFTYTAAPTRPVEGILKDAKTGKPLVNAEIRSESFAGSNWVGIHNLKVKSDAQGQFRLLGMPKGKGNRLLVVPNDEQPYLLQRVNLPDPPGMSPVKIEVLLHRGLWAEGKLTEKATGKPVSDTWIHYWPFRSNTFAQTNPSFDEHGNGSGTSYQDRYLTKADGSFRVVVLPGRGIVGANVHKKAYLQGSGSESIQGMDKSGHFATYNNPIHPGKLWPTVMKEIDPPAESGPIHLDLQVTTGASVAIKITDPNGAPITGMRTQGLTGRSSWEQESLASSDTNVTNLFPGEERSVLLVHEAKKLGLVILVREGDDTKGPVVATLKSLATITGHVVDSDGTPVAAAQVRTDILPGGDFGMRLTQVVSDAQGRFQVPDVPTGCDYALAVEAGTLAKDRRYVFHKSLSVKPGETTDVGDLKFKKD